MTFDVPYLPTELLNAFFTWAQWSQPIMMGKSWQQEHAADVTLMKPMLRSFSLALYSRTPAHWMEQPTLRVLRPISISFFYMIPHRHAQSLHFVILGVSK